MSDFRDIDPRELRPATSRRNGADPIKLHRQMARFGTSTDGMPPLIVYESSDGVLVIYDGVTRATRIAKLAPGRTVKVEVIGQLRQAYSSQKTIGELL